jgi:hypothetical protein
MSLAQGQCEEEEDTIAEERDLLDRGRIVKEVEMHKGNLLFASVLDGGLDAGVVDLGEGDIEGWGVGRKSQSAIDEGQNGRSEDSDLHDDWIGLD